MTIDSKIRELLEAITEELRKSFQENLKCLILYGSWAKGVAREDSDIDLLAVFEKVDSNTRKLLYDIETDAEKENSITLVPASIKEFRKEEIPLYTAVKKEGKIIWGDMDLTINPEPPHIKYAEALRKSKEFEMLKVKMAEEILKEHPSYGAVDLCFIASKHAIQMALATKGLGYSSKVAVLLPLAEKHLGQEIAETFKRLFGLYVKSEYGLDFLTGEESKLAVKYAKKVMEVYELT
ncbi:MAG: nucleotidyltransferase domain-containing protein [Nitrospirota bacterium]